MAITTKNRRDLKSYFVKNAIPTEGNFADLVDGQLNQADDGVFKLAGEPFSVVAAAGEQKRTLRLYSNYPAANPDWLISLNPAQDPANAATNRPGFGIADGAGRTRLFIDPSGNLGVGTNEPQGALDIRVPPNTSSWHRFVVTTTTAWGDGANNPYVTIGAGGAAGIMFWNPHVPWMAGENRASIRYGRTGGTSGNTWWDAGVRTDGAFTLQSWENGGGGDVFRVNKVGTATAIGGLAVDGTVAHLERDGAFYRNADGQVYITVDDHLYIRDLGSNTWAAHFDTNNGNREIKGALYAGTSDIYFNRTDHNHTAIGNTLGWAAIENAANYDGLMILGRQTATGRKVRVWDYFQVNGRSDLTAGALINGIGIGTQDFGGVPYPYETIQLNPAYNLRVSFGSRERFRFENSGALVIQFNQGYWVFQTDGNLVKYRNNNQAIWASGQGW